MSYEAREGVDYIVDLYSITAGPDIDVAAVRAADNDTLKRLINGRLREYHPDRLEGVAPEFQERGKQMAGYLLKARTILLDPKKREEYDDILNNWEGLLSTDGTPIASIEKYAQAMLGHLPPEEVEAHFARQTALIEDSSKYTPALLEFLEGLVANGDPSAELRAQYEAMLLAYDKTLVMEEEGRGQLLGLPDTRSRSYRAGLDYGDKVTAEIETAREHTIRDQQLQAVGGVTTRLAILAGERPPEPSTDISTTFSTELPAYFEPQAEKIKELAIKRQAVTAKRLANLTPEYLEAEHQTTALPKLLIKAITERGPIWLAFEINTEANVADGYEIPDDITALLDAEEFKALIEAGHNIAAFKVLAQVELEPQIIEVLEKHIATYRAPDKDI